MKFKREVEPIMRDSDDIEDEITKTTKTVIKDVLMSIDLTTSAYHLSDFRDDITRQLLSRNIGESILHDSVDFIVAKTLLYFQTYSKGFP